jgi:hypothetical protein
MITRETGDSEAGIPYAILQKSPIETEMKFLLGQNLDASEPSFQISLLFNLSLALPLA